MFKSMSASIHVDGHSPALEFDDVQYPDCDMIHLVGPVAAAVASVVLLLFVVVFHCLIIALK